ncbi:MAG: HPr-rel-A system PqqD family peptide chaperone [Myxococcales bacterium]|nr:HPr-rel-A system PqqD family peptide chaperone [Myxococcales bacterium]
MQLDTLRQLAVSDAGFVFDPMSGHTFSVNPTGKQVLAMLKDGHDLEAITGALAEQFELEGGEDLTRDVEDFVARLREYGLVR